MVGTLLNIRIYRYTNYKIIVCIDELFVLTSNNVLYLLDVFHGNQVAWIRHTGMAVLLLVKQRKFSLLVWHEEHLIENYNFCRRYAVNE